MAQPLDYLLSKKKEELSASWLSKTFVRYKIKFPTSSLSYTFLNSYQEEKDIAQTDINNLYNEVKKYLGKDSGMKAEDIYTKIFKENRLKYLIDKYKIKLVYAKDKKNYQEISFSFEDYPGYSYYFFPSEVRKLRDNSNLLKIIANIDLDRPYNYFETRIEEKLLYCKIDSNIKKLKENDKKDDDLCNDTIFYIRRKKAFFTNLGFFRNIFSNKVKKDYQFYLYLYSQIFKINIIIFIPWKDEITVENIIENNPKKPYLIVYHPINRGNIFKVENGGILIDRKINKILLPSKHQDIITKIKQFFESRDNKKPIIEFLKASGSKYYSISDEEEDIDERKLEEYLEKIKYYTEDLI